MRKSIKAALFSALVFPGSGHFVLGQRIRGALLAVVSIACLFILVSSAVEIAQAITDRLLGGDIALDADSISAEIERQSAAGGSRFTGIASWGLLGCWLLGIVDSFRAGWLEDRADRT